MRLAWLAVSTAAIFAACASGGLHPDEALAALGVRDAQQAGDATVILEGDSAPPVGFHFIRVQQGSVARGHITMQAPPAQCRPEGASCVSWTFIRPDGSEFGGAVPRGQTRVQIPLVQVFDSTTAELGSRGMNSILLTVKWVDDQGRDRESRAEGVVDIRVVRNGYQSLHETPTSREYAWEWTDSGRVYRMTTGLRAYAGVL